MRLGEELLHRVDQVAYPPGALVALLRGGGGGGRPLVLQRVEAVPVQGHLLLKLVQEVRRDPVHLAAAAVRGRAAVVPGVPAAGAVAAATAVPRGAAVVHAGESATGDGVVGGRHGHRHHHALRVDGAARRAAVVALQGAALGGAEEVGRGPGVAMVQVVVQGVVAVGQAAGVGRGRELELGRAAARETLHVPGWGGVAVLIEVLRGRP